ncbi:hypothetical protein G6F35_009992 [Rhizopus arrhizus]|nr:hypothetical protein G6F35_009992 [Rhizopus arrhizus]
MRRAQPLLVSLAGQAGADVLRDEGQQALVVHAERAALAVALHHDRAHHFIVAQQGHAQPAMRAGAGFAHFAGGQQRVDLRTRGQQRAPVAHHVLGQAAAERSRRTTGIVLVHRIDEIQSIARRVDQCDVKVARIEQAPDHAMHLPVELGQAVGRHRHLGNVVQRGLQLFGATALGHFILQAAVGAPQFLRAPFYLLLQPYLRLAPVHGGLHVLGHEPQQGPLGLTIAGSLFIALHHDGAAYAAIAQHRHAQPVQAFRPALGVVLLLHHPRQQFARRATERPAMAQQRYGQTARHLAGGVALRWIGNEIIHLVGEVQEADLVPHIVVLDDVAVLRVHQRAQHAVHVAQHLAHLKVGTGQVGDLEQRLLQALGLFQRLDLPGLAATLQGQFHRLPGQPPPRGRGRRAGHRQQQPRTVVLPAVLAIADAGFPGGAPRHRQQGPSALATAQLRVIPAHTDHRRFRQQRMQRAHQRRAQHDLVWWLFRRFSIRGQMTISWRRLCVASPEPSSIARHPGGNGSPQTPNRAPRRFSCCP